MASSVQFENTYPEDDRWLDAGADAFALHFAACCYTDRWNKDGVMPKAMASRVALAVPPERVPAAVGALLLAGFWTEDKTSYRIVNFLEDKIGIPAEEKLANRARWAEDKRWRRKHNVGNHAECPPEKCRQSGKVSQSDISGTPAKTPSKAPKRVQGDSSRTTRLDTTRLDSTPVGGSESESEGRPAGPASAGATAYPGSAKKQVHSVAGYTFDTAEQAERYRTFLSEMEAEEAVDADPADDGLRGLIADHQDAAG